MRIIAKFLTMAAFLAGSAMAGPALTTDKTLVSWVCLANMTQQGDQQANAVENADDKTLVQMTTVYKGSQISIYRNGEPYASCEASNEDLLKAQNQAVFGLRHEGAEPTQTLRGSIEEARIYDKALTAEEIRKLEPNKESGIKPYAWWTFEKGMETDRMGRFPVNTLSGGAKIEGGRLVLDAEGFKLIAAGKEVSYTMSPDGFKTPVFPENPPANWLTYHLVHPGPGRAEPGDPNCAFYWKDRYHLHYIYDADGGPAYAHVSSTDMVHWKWHPTTLTPKSTGHGMFSGTGFITKDGKPAIIYHGWWSERNQLAFALDDNLEKWTKPVAIMPKEPSGEDSKVRQWDPDCWLNGDALELELTVKAPVAKEFGLDVLCDKDGKNGLRIVVAGESKLLKVGNVEAPFELKKGEDLVLRVFIDKNFVEVFANDRQAAVAAADKYVQEKTGVSLFSKGGVTEVTRVRSWKMKSIYSAE